MKAKQIAYRRAGAGDLDAACALVASAICEMERKHIFQWDAMYPTREDFSSDIQKGHLFVGELDGGIAVLYAVNKDCDEQYSNAAWKYPGSEWRVIHRLCVSPSFQNRGIAAKTLAHIEGELATSGVGAIRLDVFSENPFALALYQKAGYEKVGSADWRKGRFFLMEKQIPRISLPGA